jgi:hypothetical protein
VRGAATAFPDQFEISAVRIFFGSPKGRNNLMVAAGFMDRKSKCDLGSSNRGTTTIRQVGTQVCCKSFPLCINGHCSFQRRLLPLEKSVAPLTA